MYHFAELKWLKNTNMTTVRHPPMRQDGTAWSGGGSPPPLNDNIIQQQEQSGDALFFQNYNNMCTSLLMVWSEEHKHNYKHVIKVSIPMVFTCRRACSSPLMMNSKLVVAYQLGRIQMQRKLYFIG